MIETKNVVRWIVVGAAALLGACGMPVEGEVATEEAAIFGSDACKNVDFRITNSYEENGTARLIRVLKVELYSASEGRYLTEDLVNDTVGYGDSKWWYDEDIAYAENDLITSIRVYFNYRESDGDWSDAMTQLIDIPNTNCVADTNFYLTVD